MNETKDPRIATTNPKGFLAVTADGRLYTVPEQIAPPADKPPPKGGRWATAGDEKAARDRADKNAAASAERATQEQRIAQAMAAAMSQAAAVEETKAKNKKAD